MLCQKILTLTFALVLLWGTESSGQGLPDQIQQFLQQSFFNPIRDTVKEGVAEISGIIQHISNHTSPSYVVPANNETSSLVDTTEKDTEVLPNSDEVLANTEPPSIIEQGQDLSNSSSNFSDYVEPIAISDLIPTTEQPLTTVVLESDTGAEEKTSNNNTKSSAEQRSIDNSIDKEELKKLCPELAEESKANNVQDYRYYELKEKCFKVNFQGPCGTGMKLYPKEVGSIYGVCECQPDTRLKVYHEETNACYSIFQQGYCPDGEWVDLTQKGQPICKPNPCATPEKDMVLVQGKCAEVNMKSDVCGKGEVVSFVKNQNGHYQRNAACVGFKPLGNIGGPSAVPCTPGNYAAIHGKCHVADWEFGDEKEQDPKKQ